ncbi:ArsR family transcriptional regulator, partial [Candidatus Latescibacterota bacterium]
ISQVLSISPAAVSQHLKVLRQAGFVKKERKGYWIPYSIVEDALEQCRCTINEVCACGCHGGNDHPKKAHTDNIESLEKHKIELKKELEKVEKRISQLKIKEKK